jgi:hypothetical protein
MFHIFYLLGILCRLQKIDLEGSGRGLSEVLSQHLPGGTLKKTRKASVTTAAILFEIQTEDLQDSSPVRYR